MSVRGWGVLLVFIFILSGCAHFPPDQFTEIYITSRPRSVEVYSAHNGQYLGETPLTLRYDRGSYPFPSSVAALVFKNQCGSDSEIFVIDRWASTQSDATLRANNILAEIEC